MDHHSSTTTCRSTNIRYSSHNMYLVFRVTSKQQDIQLYIIRIAEKHFYNITVNYKEPYINL
jgi:hypothetical protein